MFQGQVQHFCAVGCHMAEFEFFAAQMLSSWRSSVRAISLTIMAKYGKDDFVALVALDVIHAICVEAKSEAGAPHGKTHEGTHEAF